MRTKQSRKNYFILLATVIINFFLLFFVKPNNLLIITLFISLLSVNIGLVIYHLTGNKKYALLIALFLLAILSLKLIGQLDIINLSLLMMLALSINHYLKKGVTDEKPINN